MCPFVSGVEALSTLRRSARRWVPLNICSAYEPPVWCGRSAYVVVTVIQHVVVAFGNDTFDGLGLVLPFRQHRVELLFHGRRCHYKCTTTLR